MKKKKIAALSLAVLVAGTGAFHAYGSYQQSGESNAQLLAMEDVDAQSFEWSDLWDSITGYFEDGIEYVVEKTEELYNKKCYTKSPKQKAEYTSSGSAVSTSASVGNGNSGAGATASASSGTSSTTTTFEGYYCVNGDEYAHCSEVRDWCTENNEIYLGEGPGA